MKIESHIDTIPLINRLRDLYPKIESLKRDNKFIAIMGKPYGFTNETLDKLEKDLVNEQISTRVQLIEAQYFNNHLQPKKNENRTN